MSYAYELTCEDETTNINVNVTLVCFNSSCDIEGVKL